MSDAFVENVAAAFRRRAKSLRNHGTLELEVYDEGFEVRIGTTNYAWLILDVEPHRRLTRV